MNHSTLAVDLSFGGISLGELRGPLKVEALLREVVWGEVARDADLTGKVCSNRDCFLHNVAECSSEESLTR